MKSFCIHYRPSKYHHFKEKDISLSLHSQINPKQMQYSNETVNRNCSSSLPNEYPQKCYLTNEHGGYQKHPKASGFNFVNSL